MSQDTDLCYQQLGQSEPAIFHVDDACNIIQMGTEKLQTEIH